MYYFGCCLCVVGYTAPVIPETSCKWLVKSTYNLQYQKQSTSCSLHHRLVHATYNVSSSRPSFNTSLTKLPTLSTVSGHVHYTTDWFKLPTLSTQHLSIWQSCSNYHWLVQAANIVNSCQQSCSNYHWLSSPEIRSVLGCTVMKTFPVIFPSTKLCRCVLCIIMAISVALLAAWMWHLIWYPDIHSLFSCAREMINFHSISLSRVWVCSWCCICSFCITSCIDVISNLICTEILSVFCNFVTCLQL